MTTDSPLLFTCITDRTVPIETMGYLRLACEQRGIVYEEIDANSFDYDASRALPPGSIMYKPAVSMAAWHAEQFLAHPQLATFYKDTARIAYDCNSSWLVMDQAGVPIPRTMFCHSTDRDILRAQVERLGGLPIVVKVQGGSGGIGTMRADSYPALFSLVDYLLHRGTAPLLAAFVDDAVHWRAVVVGDRVVAKYPNLTETDDFRTSASSDEAFYHQEIPEAAAEAAIAATHALGFEFGGVDVMVHASGRPYVLEVNMPCYYAQAQRRGNIDVSGAMVEHLAAKARRILSDIGPATA